MSINYYLKKSDFYGNEYDIPFFVIDTENTTYAFDVKNGYVNNAYWGKKLKNHNDIPLGMQVMSLQSTRSTMWRQKEEYSAFGGKFYDNESLKVTFPDGVRDTVLKYEGYEISEDNNTLIIILKDEVYPLKVSLVYKIYNGLDIIDRYTVIENQGEEEITLNTFYSAQWIMPYSEKQRLTFMRSAWGHEGEIKTAPIDSIITLESRAGISAAEYAPYFAIDDYSATEHSGNVWFGTLQWSGNWQMHIFKDTNRIVKVTGGISNFDCDLILKGGENFETPIFTGGFVANGFGTANRQLHDYQRKTNKTAFVNQVMPVLYNAWSTFEYDISEELIIAQAEHFKELGVEMLVIDDGWFKGRNTFNAGLGDWVPDPKKFPNGLKPVVEHINSLGIKFGIWVEPEMINPNSDLYREHPDWIMNYPTRQREERKNQLTLNLAREDVFEFTKNWLDKLLSSANIELLKWDMNRYFSQAGWPEIEIKEQKSIYIKYVQNFVRLLRFINEKYPHVLIENCASGGLRADLGTNLWCGRVNRSDNQDAIDILQLHEGFTKINLAKMAGGGCHFHHTPNAVLNGRSETMKRMAYTAFNGSLAIGYDLRRLSDEEKKELKGYIDYYKKIRETVQLGDMYVLNSAFNTDSNFVAFQYVSKDKKKSVIFVYANNIGFRPILVPIMPKGLDSDKMYSVKFVDSKFIDSYPDTTGDGLMNIGIITSNKPAFFDTVYDCFAIEIEEK
ncbi:MAG: alpha-galactosidase [Ruminococcaceae bacterium]|nr:alpha-galactosidase [Oscillospiraceae bacterium]